jgi:hypothetical protein
MQPAPRDVMMTKTVRNTFHAIGDRGGDVAKSIGHGTADIAKRVGRGTSDLATRIGPRRGLIGLAVLAVAIGGSVVLIRYLRARNAEKELGMDDSGLGTNSRGAKSPKRSHGSDTRASY